VTTSAVAPVSSPAFFGIEDSAAKESDKLND